MGAQFSYLYLPDHSHAPTTPGPYFVFFFNFGVFLFLFSIYISFLCHLPAESLIHLEMIWGRRAY
jgi:hypothetical protein